MKGNKLYWLIKVKLAQGNFISPSVLMRAYYLSSQQLTLLFYFKCEVWLILLLKLIRVASTVFLLIRCTKESFISDARYDSYSARRQTDQQESRLLSHLMENYDKEVRPVINASKAVEVRVGITLTQIFDMVSWNTEEKAWVWPLIIGKKHYDSCKDILYSKTFK